MLDADRAVGEDVGAVDDSPFVVGVALVVSELLKHLELVDHGGGCVFVLPVGRIAGVQLHGDVEGLLCLLDAAQGQLRLVEPLVDAGELAINSDACLAVFDGTSVLLERDEAGGPVRENLLSGLNVARLCVKGDGGHVIAALESIVALGLLGVSQRIYCCFYHLLIAFIPLIRSQFASTFFYFFF